MVLMVIMNNLESSLKKGETVVGGIFRFFQKPLILLTTLHYLLSKSIMVFEEMIWLGLGVISLMVNHF